MEPDELTLAYAWQEQALQGDLRTTDDRPLRVVYRGVWTHRLGPDFAGALIDLAGELVSGDVELHVRSSDWYKHRHHEDPAYDRVILHVVWNDDLREVVRRRDGFPVPTLEIGRFVTHPLELVPGTPPRPLGSLGLTHCAPEIAATEPRVLQELFEHAGDERMREKVKRTQARLAGEPPVQTLYWLLADALGYHRNREAMQAIAEALPVTSLEARLQALPPDRRFPQAAALLLGTAGFLPSSDAERALVELPSHTWQDIDSLWASLGAPNLILGTPWRLAGIRPANHPLRRLLSLAGLLAGTRGGLLVDVLDRVQAPHPRRELLAWLTTGPVPLGNSRAHEILVNVVIPFTLAYAEWTDNDELREVAARLWLELPAGQGNRVVRVTLEQVCGPIPFRLRSARAEQGVLHLYWRGCHDRRCWECPVAHLVLTRDEGSRGTDHAHPT